MHCRTGLYVGGCSFGRNPIGVCGGMALATASYNVNNQQTTFGTNTLMYDFNGNLQTVTDAGGTATYSWNARNQLAGISSTGFAASFSYDSFGRRTGKTIQGTTTNFVYDGLNPVQEKAGATVTANLLTGLGIDEFLTRTDGAGTRGLLTDALGTTVALGDGTGTIQTQYTYEPFGYASQTGSANTNSYKYTGREDDGSGLYYYRARYYHPRLQRFIAEDPVMLLGGVNYYGYAENNPLFFIDPYGLAGGPSPTMPRPQLPFPNPYQRDQNMTDLLQNMNRAARQANQSQQDYNTLNNLPLDPLGNGSPAGPIGYPINGGNDIYIPVRDGGPSIINPTKPIIVPDLILPKVPALPQTNPLCNGGSCSCPVNPKRRP